MVTRRTLTVELLGVPAGAGVERRRAERWLRALIAELAPEADSFCARFVDDAEMRELNRRWRGKDRATDVLSFPGEATPEGRHLGDVVISLDAARRQAAAGGRELAEEVQTLLLHGALHCLGLDHETDDGEMEEAEARLRRRWTAGDGAFSTTGGGAR
ncbi:MAG TPA: rRNA maturation RNase YbeY [Thermoanaerobaculia bacterium]|nr:rRNA maturation RNase YbeY [Thermoanaerobaculia bacterium]